MPLNGPGPLPWDSLGARAQVLAAQPPRPGGRPQETTPAGRYRSLQENPAIGLPQPRPPCQVNAPTAPPWSRVTEGQASSSLARTHTETFARCLLLGGGRKRLSQDGKPPRRPACRSTPPQERYPLQVGGQAATATKGPRLRTWEPVRPPRGPQGNDRSAVGPRPRPRPRVNLNSGLLLLSPPGGHPHALDPRPRPVQGRPALRTRAPAQGSLRAPDTRPRPAEGSPRASDPRPAPPPRRHPAPQIRIPAQRSPRALDTSPLPCRASPRALDPRPRPAQGSPRAPHPRPGVTPRPGPAPLPGVAPRPPLCAAGSPALRARPPLPGNGRLRHPGLGPRSGP
uniref:Proline-rich protein HaeIII subfamily 1-like n=1 Tax=Callorhinus ursinus TaxID=34884 RepID=A0A3Q7N7V3_CALUR|nr:proline-rich protein HaeIII subfamily 1-like [Callorhinus ursinus]